MAKKAKFKIKTRKQRKEIFKSKYNKVDPDSVQRIIDYFGGSLTESFIEDVNDRVHEIEKNMTYSKINLTFYETPVQSHRPRTRGYGRNMYVPNAKENWDFVGDLIEGYKEDIKVVCTPCRINLKAFYDMPSGISKKEICLYELGHLRPITSPDFDNVLKAYTDMIQKHILVNDDIVCECLFEKYHSLLPRVEMTIIYQDHFASKSAYKRMKSRTSFKELAARTEISLI